METIRAVARSRAARWWRRARWVLVVLASAVGYLLATPSPVLACGVTYQGGGADSG